MHESSEGGVGAGVGSGVQLSVGGEGGEAVEDFSAGPGGGQHPGHAFGGAGFPGGFPLHDADGDGPGSGGPAFFVGGAAAGWGSTSGPGGLAAVIAGGPSPIGNLALGSLSGIGRRRHVLLNP